VRACIAAASRRSGRDPAAVTLVGASKGQPVERLRAAYDAGLRIFGENRVQEAQRKAAQLPLEIEWHLLGPLQSNKAKAAAGLFRTVHAIESVEIGLALEHEAAARGAVVDGFLEVNLGGEQSKHGFPAAGLAEAIAPLAGLAHLRLVGLMAVPPEEASAEAMRPWFRRLRALRDELLPRPQWPALRGLSMGMSADFEVAIEEGSTHVRVGTALFGARG
jgi:pyridoxal phosphate enzyme (YggS family)